MNIDPELKAMNDAYEALKELDDESRQRVINWIIGKFSLSKIRQGAGLQKQGQEQVSISEQAEITSFNSLADIFAKAHQKNDAEKVLVIASYLQETRGGTELTGREINKELHHLGHRVTNITVAINSLMNRKPQLMIQTRKEGTSQQAHKKYKVSAEGLNAVKKMISVAADE